MLVLKFGVMVVCCGGELGNGIRVCVCVCEWSRV
jgi:hypothetical protein